MAKEDLNKLINNKIVLAKADNGIILTDVAKGDNSVLVYEVVNEDGSMNYDAFAKMIYDISVYMNIPLVCEVSGLAFVPVVTEIENVKFGEEGEYFDDDEEDDI